MTASSKLPNLITAAQSLFYLNAIIWLAIGVASLIRMSNDSPELVVIMGVIAALMFGNAAAMVWSGFGLGKGGKYYYFVALAVISINIILTVTDEFGIYDLITLVIDMIIFGILIAIRKNYLAS